MDSPRPIVVIGAGITGLACAHRITEQSESAPILLESANHAGGTIDTYYDDDSVVERGPDNFIINKPWAMELISRLGLEDELQHPNPDHRRVLILKKGRLLPIPAGFQVMGPTQWLPMMFSPVLSWRGKARMLTEIWKAPRTIEDESLESFALRRFGREAYETLIQPLVAGIYTADPRTLSLKATLPQFIEMEQKHGSVIKGLRHAAREKRRKGDAGVRYGLFRTFKRGMKTLIDGLVDAIKPENIRFNTSVERIQRHSVEPNTWEVCLTDGEPILASAVIIATAPAAAARLLETTDTRLRTQLSKIDAASAAIIHLGFKREQVEHRLDAFGFVVPHQEQHPLLAGTFTSTKYAGRAPAGHALMRTFVGGALAPEMLEQSDEQILELASRELGKLLKIQGEPVFHRICRYPQAMPQYTIGHQERIRELRDVCSSHSGLFLAGNAYAGVGIPDCIHAGEKAAEAALAIRKPVAAAGSRPAD